MAGVSEPSTVTGVPSILASSHILEANTFTSIPFKTVEAPGELSRPRIKL
jgi:hypothetical protein